MYLKSLTLKGFKSFADRTQMTFDPGLTVIVGPNGSGKSNVSDAVLWVLGEQSAKALRGQAMEDVIFSGSSARSAVGVAEVTLVLDNSDHTLPIEFAEVAVTRRMYRSGESEYLINGAPARLMDVRDILHDSGLGKETHSIISQGKLDGVLQGRPEDRRELIEEAAGIAKHRRRKDRSERKLASMDRSLTRAKDISKEIHRQLRPLERQANKAREAAQLQERVAELSCQIAVDDLRALQERHGSLKGRQNEAEAAIELARYRLGEKNAELQKLQSLLEEKGLFVGDLGEQRRRLQDQLGRMDSDMRLLEEKGKNMVSRLSDMRMSLSTMERQHAGAVEQHERVLTDLAEARAREAALRADVDRLQPEAKEATKTRRTLSERHNRLTGDLRQAQRRADDEALAASKAQGRISNAEVEDQMFASRLSQLDEALDTALARKQTLTTRKEEADAALEAAEARVSKAGMDVAGAEDALAKARDAHELARGRLTEATTSLAALRSVDEQVEGADPLVGALVADDEVKDAIQCRLADLVDVPDGLEGVVEALLGDDLAALVVDDADDARKVVSRALALSDSHGAATVVARSEGAAVTLPADAPGTPLVERVTAAFDASDAVAALFAGVRLVDSLDEALAAHEAVPQGTYVTPEAIMVLPDGRLRVGTAATQATGSLARKRRIRSLDASVPKLEQEVEATKARVDACEAELADARSRQGDAQGERAQAQGDLAAVTSELSRLVGQLDHATSEREQVEERRQKAASKAEAAREEVKRHEEAAAEASAEVTRLTDELADVDASRQEASRTENDLDRRLSDVRLELATVSERRHHLESRETGLAKDARDLEERISSTERSTHALEVVRLRVDPLHDRYAAIEKRAQEWASRLRDTASLAEADSDSLKKTISDARDAVEAARAELERATGALGDIKVEAGRLEVQVEGLVSSIVEGGAYELEEALRLPPLEDREAATKTLTRLKGQIERLGPVNAVASEEYESLRQRAEYVDEQIADLEGARKSLQRISAAIERKMRQQFLDVFEQVNQNFQTVFGLLFPGGSAHLVMTDPDHPSETGIDVVAQPRGKKIAKMMLMSGGEKSLTALALLFAVYRTRTVPFYIFDEVEAALDDANLSKLLDAIESLKESTQLIVISHQRRTMEQADVLYGVSMQADGVSHVISQRIDRSTGKVVDN